MNGPVQSMQSWLDHGFSLASISHFRRGYILSHPVHALRLLLRGIRRGIRGLWQWRKIAWHDRDWDYAFLLEVMEFKLTRMAETIGDGYHLHADRQAVQMRTAAALCRRIRNDDHMHILEAPCDKIMAIDMGPAIGPWVRYGHNSARLGQFPGLKKKYYKFYSTYMSEQDLDYLTLLLRKYMQSWWD